MPTETETSPRELRGDRIVELVKAEGLPCYAEHSGGGVATIYAGKAYTLDGEERHPVLVGPGWFAEYTHDARFTTADLYVGPADDGRMEWHAFLEQTVTVGADWTEEQVAAEVVRQLREFRVPA